MSFAMAQARIFGHDGGMAASSRVIVVSAFAFLAVGFVALVAIVAANFWLSQRAESFFTQQIAARDTRAAAVELRNDVQSAESAQRARRPASRWPRLRLRRSSGASGTGA